jgi:hypothetical protein
MEELSRDQKGFLEGSLGVLVGVGRRNFWKISRGFLKIP